MRLVDVRIGNDFGQIWMRIVSDDGLLVVTQILKELVCVDDTICELICHLLHCELIEHRQAAAENKSFDGVLRINMVIVLNVGLLREELRGGLGRDDELIHDFAHFCIRHAVGGTGVNLERVAGIDHEVPVVAQGVVTLARVLELDVVTFHVSTHHVMNLLVKLSRVPVRINLWAWHWHVVLQAEIWVDLHPDALYVAVNFSLKMIAERVQAVSNEKLVLIELKDRVVSVRHLRDLRGELSSE